MNTAHLLQTTKVSNFLRYISILFLAFSVTSIKAVELKVPVVNEAPDVHLFYAELLSESFKLINQPITIAYISAPHVRTVKNLEAGKVDLLWMIETKQRNEQFEKVDVGLTNGLIGKRIALIRPETQAEFDNITNLAELQNSGLVAAVGTGWYDGKVWKANALRFKEQQGNWLSIYPKLAKDRDFDYFPRGLNEIIRDSEVRADLVIEENLVLEYSRDFVFYLGPSGAQHHEILTNALQHARNSGLIDRLVTKYWGTHFLELNYESRIIIHLKSPN